VGGAARTRMNLLLHAGKVRKLRRALRATSNSAALRRVIDDRLAVEEGLRALGALRRFGGIEDVFGRAPKKRR